MKRTSFIHLSHALSALLLLGAAPAFALDIMVSAASSLTNAFNEIGKAYERERQDMRVLFNFGASGVLLQQISRGAPVDVLATADQETMERAQTQNLIYRESRANFAANKLLLVAPGGATSKLANLQGLANPDVKRIAVGNPESVPVGRYAKAALEKAGLWEQLTSKLIFTQNVRQSLDYVARGEVDAGFVYATDAAMAPVKIQSVLETPTERPIVYPIAVVKGFGNERTARDFIAFVQSETGQKILAKYGFLKP
jgi:molybdate transport system substrate-binding protein